MKLYKYLPPDRVEVLENCLIRYTQRDDLNDPISEMVLEAWLRSFIPPDALQKPHHIPANKAEQVSEEIKKALWAGVINFAQKEFHETLGVFCLSEKPDDPTMWSRYALVHRGFVIGFDSEHPYFKAPKDAENKLQQLQKVDYRDAPPNRGDVYSVMDVLLTKSMDSAYEQEWRIFRRLQDADKIINIPGASFPVHLFRFPPEAIVEIIFGSKMIKETRDKVIGAIKEWAHFRRIELRQAYLVTTNLFLVLSQGCQRSARVACFGYLK